MTGLWLRSSIFVSELSEIVRRFAGKRSLQSLSTRDAIFGIAENSIKAKAVLLVSMWPRGRAVAGYHGKVGTVAVRNAILANATTVSFAAGLRHQGIKKLVVGDVGRSGGKRAISPMAPIRGSSIWDLLATGHIDESDYKEGPGFFKRTVEECRGVEKAADTEATKGQSFSSNSLRKGRSSYNAGDFGDRYLPMRYLLK